MAKEEKVSEKKEKEVKAPKKAKLEVTTEYEAIHSVGVLVKTIASDGNNIAVSTTFVPGAKVKNIMSPIDEKGKSKVIGQELVPMSARI